jgi:hypothetical protein
VQPRSALACRGDTQIRSQHESRQIRGRFLVRDESLGSNRPDQCQVVRDEEQGEPGENAGDNDLLALGLLARVAVPHLWP